jgi:hypothetical protein
MSVEYAPALTSIRVLCVPDKHSAGRDRQMQAGRFYILHLGDPGWGGAW